MTSLSSSVLEYEYENGRRYHSNRTVRISDLMRLLIIMVINSLLGTIHVLCFSILCI